MKRIDTFANDVDGTIPQSTLHKLFAAMPAKLPTPASYSP